MTTETLVPLDQHNQLTAGPAPWTETRVPAQLFHVARAVYGTSTHEDDQRVYRTVQAVLMLQAQQQVQLFAPVPEAPQQADLLD